MALYRDLELVTISSSTPWPPLSVGTGTSLCHGPWAASTPWSPVLVHGHGIDDSRVVAREDGQGGLGESPTHKCLWL